MRNALKTICYIVLLFVPYAVDHPPHLPAENPCASEDREGPGRLSDRLYNQLTALGYRDVESKFTAVVLLKQDELPDSMFENVCDQRGLMSALLLSIDDAHPTMIVLDKWFSPTACATPENTEKLLNAVERLSVPIVIGLNTQKADDLPSLTAKEQEALRKGCLVLAPSLGFRQGPRDHVHYGLLRANADLRKIPLAWSTFGSRADLAHENSRSIPTISFRAATLRNPKLGRSRTVKALQDAGRHPFTSFLMSKDIPTISAKELLCGKSFPGISIPACEMTAAKSQLTARIVVVGEDHDRDRFNTPVERRMPGVTLQANYIESLLDGRFLRPVPGKFETAAVLAWIVFLELWFRAKRPPEILALFALALAMTLWIACCLVTLLKGYFILLWGLPAVLAILIKYVDTRRERLLQPDVKTAPESGGTPA